MDEKQQKKEGLFSNIKLFQKLSMYLKECLSWQEKEQAERELYGREKTVGGRGFTALIISVKAYMAKHKRKCGKS